MRRRSKAAIVTALGLVVAGSLAACGTAKHTSSATHAAQSPSSPSFAVSYAGMDYQQPNGELTGCNYYTWLEPACYTNSDLTPFHVSPQRQLSTDMSWIAANHMGHFQRLFIGLDELFSCFDKTTGFCGYSDSALANLDDALSIVAAAHQKVDLTLFIQDNTAGFHFEALDGYHPQMEQNYVEAVRQFVQHVAANETDSSVISVIDLENEAYYQNSFHLSTMPNICGANWGCIYSKITRPWLAQLYDVAKSIAPRFNYTASSTVDLLESGQQAYFLQLYAGIVDVYDIHLYSGTPWDLSATLTNARNLNKPWFVGEAGCSSNGSSLCTYDGGNVNCSAPAACSLSVDTWWLENLHRYGASAVLVENARTCFIPSAMPTATLVGQQLIKASEAESSPATAHGASRTSRRGGAAAHPGPAT